MSKLIVICLFSVAAGSLGLAQSNSVLSPPPAPSGLPAGYVARNTAGKSSQPAQPPVVSADPALQHSDRTKVIRIYPGPGYFDDALAYKIRPALFKAFPFAKPEPVKPAPGLPKTSPAKVEGQIKMTGKPRL